MKKQFLFFCLAGALLGLTACEGAQAVIHNKLTLDGDEYALTSAELYPEQNPITLNMEPLGQYYKLIFKTYNISVDATENRYVMPQKGQAAMLVIPFISKCLNGIDSDTYSFSTGSVHYLYRIQTLLSYVSVYYKDQEGTKCIECNDGKMTVKRGPFMYEIDLDLSRYPFNGPAQMGPSEEVGSVHYVGIVPLIESEVDEDGWIGAPLAPSIE